jgi:hypothetical protein
VHGFVLGGSNSDVDVDVDAGVDVDTDVDVDVDVDVDSRCRGSTGERHWETKLTSSCKKLFDARQLSRSSEVPGHVSSNSHEPSSSHARGPSISISVLPLAENTLAKTWILLEIRYSSRGPSRSRSRASSRHKGRLVLGIGMGSMDHARPPFHEVFHRGISKKDWIERLG